ARASDLIARLETVLFDNEKGCWPRAPHSCFSYGRDCHFSLRCWGNHRETFVPLQNPLVSQSMISMIDECPRKYYLTCAASESDVTDYHEIGESGEAALFGTMFHHGMAEIYREAKRVNS